MIFGCFLVILTGGILGHLMMKDIRKGVSLARKDVVKGEGIAIGSVIVWFVLIMAITLGESRYFQVSQLWFFPSFMIVTMIHALRQYQQETGNTRFESLPVNHEFIESYRKSLKRKDEE